MSVFTEGAPLEVLEEVGDNIGDIAKNARDEIINIQRSGENELTTTGISDFKYWLKDKALENENSASKTEGILQATGFIKSDEKYSVGQKVTDIIEMLDDLITNPIDFKMKYPSNLNMLIKLLEAYSGEIKS